MKTYIVETTARASIREFWRVEAESEDEAREAIEDGGGIASEFLFDETTGDEEGREAVAVHAGDYLTGSLDLRRAEAAAPAMLAALERVLPLAMEALADRATSEDDEDREHFAEYRADVESAKAAIAQARGTPTSGQEA